MVAKDDGGPAFPRTMARIVYPQGDAEFDPGTSGMTLRDWFAGQALAGIMARPNIAESAIELAWKQADAMLVERNRK